MVVTRWGRPWFSSRSASVIGVLMVCYVAVPSSLIGIKPTSSETGQADRQRRERERSAPTVCTPPYVLGRIGILMLGSQRPLHPRHLRRSRSGFTLQAGATGAVKAVKLSAHLVAGGASTTDADASEARRLLGDAEQPP